MEFNWENFTIAYQKASTELKAFIDSGIIADFTRDEVAKESSLSENQQLLIVALSHYILKATPENEIVEILVTNGIKNVSRILNDFNASYTKDVDSTPVTPPPTQSLVSQITMVEKELASIQTVRTMPHDMAAIKPGSDVVYQSSQADILARGEGTVPNVASAAPEAPRWDTDTRSQ